MEGLQRNAEESFLCDLCAELCDLCGKIDSAVVPFLLILVIALRPLT
jgi:hypothetical protein